MAFETRSDYNIKDTVVVSTQQAMRMGMEIVQKSDKTGIKFTQAGISIAETEEVCSV
jgi:hypothetical protein